MNNFILLVACFLIGMLLQRSGRLPANAHAALNGFVIHISLPALTLLYVHALRVEAKLLFPIAMAWVMFGVGFLVFRVLGRVLKLPRRPWRPHPDGLTCEHLIHRASNDRDVLRTAGPGPGHPDRPDGYLSGAVDFRPLGGGAVRSRSGNQRAVGDTKIADLRALRRTRRCGPLDSSHIPRVVRRAVATAGGDVCPWHSYRSAIRSSGVLFAESFASWEWASGSSSWPDRRSSRYSSPASSAPAERPSRLRFSRRRWPPDRCCHRRGRPRS